MSFTLGVSDISAVLGRNPYRSPVDVYYDKINPVKYEDNERQKIGRIVEESIIRLYEEESGYAVERNPGRLEFPNYPKIVGRPDGVINFSSTSKGILEAKNTGDMTESEKPLWEVQLQFYMYMAGVEEGAVAALYGGQKFKIWEYSLDTDFIEDSFEKAKHFIEHNLEKRIVPDPINEKDVVKIYPASKPSTFKEADDAMMLAFSKLKDIRNDLKVLETEESGLLFIIKAYIADNETLIHKGSPLATFKNSRAGSKLNIEALVKDLNIDTKPYMEATSGSRRFLIK